MKALRFFFILICILHGSLTAYAKSQVLFIDPKFENTVPVYGVDKNGKISKEVTSLLPGDFASLKETRKINGKTWFVIKAKDASGKDIELAIDSKSVNYPDNSVLYIAPENARKIKATGDGTSLTTDTPGLDSEACAVAKSAGGDICREVSTGDDIQVEDAVLALTTDGESPKLKWRNYVKGKDGYWIDTENTSRVDESFSSFDTPTKGVEDCDPKTPFDNLPDLAEETAAVGSEQQLESILKYVGECHETKTTGDYHSTIVNGVAKKKVPLMYKEMKQEDGSVQVVHANRADWVAIDVLARTLYGEMASCFRKGQQYPESVAKVVLNRVDFKNAKPAPGKRFIDPKSKTEHRNDITNAVFKDYQFSVWNREDAARRMAMCPPSSADKNFWKGSKPDEVEQKIWKEAVRIASKAVLQGESFRKKNKDLKALYYTSNFELPKQHYKPITNASIGGKKIPMSRCVQLWTEKKLKEDYPEYGDIFHPLFQKALRSVAGF